MLPYFLLDISESSLHWYQTDVSYLDDQYDNAAPNSLFFQDPLLLLVLWNNLLDLVEINSESNVDSSNQVAARYDERLTPAERRYLEQWKQLEARRLLKSANESHRDRVQRFNQYLANLSEHYDIPKVGPG